MNNRDFIPLQIRNIDQIDLDAHGVVEASAGTGKTYTIEHLVVELLKTGKVQSLDQILVVTFTEKAVSELKNRIRNIIRLSLEQEPSEILNISFENFESASIFTIHGFCNKILNDYAFENRKHLSNTLIDDRHVYQQELSRIKREIWPGEYGDQLRSVLQLSDYPGSTGTGISSWEDLVIDVALRYQLSGFDSINPPVEPDILNKIVTIHKNCTINLDALGSLVGMIDENNYIKSELCTRYASLNINQNSIKKRLRTCVALLKILSAHNNKTLSMNTLADFIIHHEFGDNGFNDLSTGWNKSGPDYETKLPYLPEIIRVLENLRVMDFAHFKTMLAVKTIHQLKHNGLTYKIENSLISYDDMVMHVYSSFQDNTSIVKKLLQKRYRYALVDEFQDTDMLQWAIFKAIFLESEHNKLFIIGDPKQAIYGFRGADINAYLLARDEMISTFKARFYSLSENWRSSPALICAFNKIFNNTNWFSDGIIQYLPSLYPEKKNPELHEDTHSLILVNCGSASGTDARLRFSDYIAREINVLISSNFKCELNEIAILVTKWKEADAIEKTFKKASIKYSFYKKEGLYQTKEALELNYLLSAIASPHDTALRKIAFATRFFNIDKLSLYHFDMMPSDHPAYMIFEKWILLAGENKWPLLFQSIMEDTGILYQIDTEDHDRQIINYKSIIQTLEIEAHRNNYCIHEVASYLNKLRLNSVIENDASNIQKLDLDKPGVQILTMHASKGLEFKVIFIGGGFTKRDKSAFWIYHINNQRVFDLIRDDRYRNMHDLERAHEEERLFYVAITRARDRVYIPIFEPASRSLSSAGLLGNKIPEALFIVRDDPGTTLVDYNQIQSFPAAQQNKNSHQGKEIILPDPLFPEIDMQFLSRSVTVDSFSGLKLKLHGSTDHYTIHTEFGPVSPIVADEDISQIIKLPVDRNVQVPAGIPHGIESGLMLHEILEKINFKIICLIDNPIDLLAEGSECDAIIDTAIKNNIKTGYSEIELLKSEVAHIIWNTLHAPLDGSKLILCKIDKKIHEAEFYYPAHHNVTSDNNDLRSSKGFIHGFIDMIFEYNEKYFLVDWKSNYIEEGYSYEMMKNNIIDMRYDMQIKIYTGALIRSLKRLISDYSYQRHFGGVFYLYMRGINLNKPGDGIFFYRPDSEPDMRIMDLTNSINYDLKQFIPE